MTCSVCHEKTEPGFAHCASKTCTWCMRCVKAKHDECERQQPKKPGR